MINNATLQYGGGRVNTPGGTENRHALEFAGASSVDELGQFGFVRNTGVGTGTHAMITDDNFLYNGNFPAPAQIPEPPINITPDGCYARRPG